MATTNTYTYNVTAADIITVALRNCTILEAGESASATQISDALPSFEAMLKALPNFGLNIWANDEFSITLVDSQGTYTSSDLADIDYWLDITDIVYRDGSGDDTTLIRLSRQEYYELSDKTSTSNQPTQYYWERMKVEDGQAGQINTLYVWPLPDSTIAGNTLKVRSQRQLQDITAGTNHVDVPQEWLEAIEYNLSVRLAVQYSIPLEERIWLKQEAKEALNLALSNDREDTSIYLAPSSVHRTR